MDMTKVMTPFGEMENHSDPNDLKHISQKTILEAKEQIQEDLRSWVCSQPYGDEAEDNCDELCQIVVDSFKKLER